MPSAASEPLKKCDVKHDPGSTRSLGFLVILLALLTARDYHRFFALEEEEEAPFRERTGGGLRVTTRRIEPERHPFTAALGEIPDDFSKTCALPRSKKL